MMRLIFAHIPKTAGTSVRTYLAPNFAHAQRVYVSRVGGIVAPSQFGAYSMPAGWRFLSGHLRISRLLSNPNIDPYDSETLLLSFVRDPVDRLISLFNYKLINPQHQPEESARARRIGAVRFIQQQEANVQTAYLSEDVPSDIAWKVMIAPVDLLSEACVAAIERSTGRAPVISAFPKRNISAGRGEGIITRGDLDPHVLNDLTERHARDATLHQSALAKGILTELPLFSGQRATG